MKYCVIKDTIIVIDGSENPIEIMLQNAQSAGFSEIEVEILTAEEYQARVDLEPELSEPTEADRLKERVQAVETKTVTLEETLEVLFGG